MDKNTYIDFEKLSFEDFEHGIPFSYLCAQKGNAFALGQMGCILEQRAKEVGFKDFKLRYGLFIAALAAENNAGDGSINTTRFTGQPLELKCSGWIGEDRGVERILRNGRKERVCAHAIMPSARIVDIETGEVKLRLSFRFPGEKDVWRTMDVEMATLSSSKSIVTLATKGIDVTSSTASALVEYINQVHMANYSEIPEYSSASRLGYYAGFGFAPYKDGIVFGADVEYKQVFQAVTKCGSYEAWLNVARECRQQSVPAKIMLAASFASPLLSIVGSLPFFVHCRSIESGTGKTVALMLAAAVWANPAPGCFIQTHNATQVGMERMAAFLNQLPYCLDELQLSKDSTGQAKIDVYQLAEGVGRTRGTKLGGVEQTQTWHNCFLSTGESSLTVLQKGAGAINRVIDIECPAGTMVLTDGARIAGIVRENYGFAGRIFVEKLYDSDAVQCAVRNTYCSFRKELANLGATEKQAMAGAAILTADHYATRWIFEDNNALTVAELAPYLAKSVDVSVGSAAYDFLCDWVLVNRNKFRTAEKEPTGDIYGAIEGSVVYIIRSVFKKALESGGYDENTVLSYLRDRGLIETKPSRGFASSKRFGKDSIQCIVMHFR